MFKVRIATKQIEAKLRKTAEEFKKNPYKVIPKCNGKCSSCYFEKIRDDVAKLKEEKYLEKMAKKKNFVAALATTMLLADQKIPYIAVMKFGNENVYYAKRGKVKDEILAGLQNWDKPHVRMLAYREIAKKKKLNIFSLPEKVLCSENVPEEFLDFLSKKFSCDEEEYVKLKWKGREIKVCKNENSLVKMKQYFYYPSFDDEIEIEAIIKKIECKNECNECVIKDALNAKIDDTAYRAGNMSDKAFVENSKKKVMWKIEAKRVFIIGDKCYGENKELFEEQLKPKEWEKDALMDIIRKERKAIIVDTPSAAKLLEKYGISSQKLKEEYEMKEKKKILSSLPNVEGEGIAKFADRLARIYKVGGRDGILRELRGLKMDVKEKAVAYAFLFTLGLKGEEWKYDKMEMDFGRHLAKYVKKLIDTEGTEYKEALEILVREVGG